MGVTSVSSTLLSGWDRDSKVICPGRTYKKTKSSDQVSEPTCTRRGPLGISYD